MSELSRDALLQRERKLAKYANMMDGMIRIPFTGKGIGLDALLSLVPVLGDVAGFLMTLYTVKQAREMGVPMRKLTPVFKWAIADAVVGSVPVIGTVFDIFIRPSRRALDIVRQHLAGNHHITDTTHVERPFLHEKLASKQAKSPLWRNPVMAWLWLHLPEIMIAFAVVLIALLAYGGYQLLVHLIDMARTV